MSPAVGCAGASPGADRRREPRIRGLPGPTISSLRDGTRPASVTMKPPSVSMSSALSSSVRSTPEALLDLVEARAGIGDEGAVGRLHDHQRRWRRRARPRCRPPPSRRDPRWRRGRRCRRIRRSRGPCGCGSPACAPAGRWPAWSAARTGPGAGCWPTASVIDRSTWPRLGRGASSLGARFRGAAVGPHGDEIQEVPDVDHALRDRRGSRHRPAGANGRRSGTG